MIWAVSTKCHNYPPGRRTSTTLSPTTAPTLMCLCRNKSDCSRVLTTSTGRVTMALSRPRDCAGHKLIRAIIASEVGIRSAAIISQVANLLSYAGRTLRSLQYRLRSRPPYEFAL